MNTELFLLLTLKGAHPHLLNTGRLWSEMLMEDSTATYSRFKTALHALEVKGQIVVISGEDKAKAKITPDGLARLAENNL